MPRLLKMLLTLTSGRVSFARILCMILERLPGLRLSIRLPRDSQLIVTVHTPLPFVPRVYGKVLICRAGWYWWQGGCERLPFICRAAPTPGARDCQSLRGTSAIWSNLSLFAILKVFCWPPYEPERVNYGSLVFGILCCRLCKTSRKHRVAFIPKRVGCHE